MAVPTSYTEDGLKAYMIAVLGAVAEVLGWSVVGGQVDEPVIESLLAYGTDDISTITGLDNIKKIRTLARREVWRAVMDETAADYDFTADGGSYSRAQIHKMAMENFMKAENEAAAFDTTWAVQVHRVTHKNDPYRYLPDEDVTP